ncbi:hypothetical protein Ahy_B07g087707 isoform C [Arachis hypogaea]|uniref:Uncharacterized protein n=1 Tax=Arachis hypogaea TaxID=3818 RepID=A0A444YCS4_ARAHY|nr:hypothetical protein Ahy_B07g087707 isoform C [Arachis hypogaea]
MKRRNLHLLFCTTSTIQLTCCVSVEERDGGLGYLEIDAENGTAMIGRTEALASDLKPSTRSTAEVQRRNRSFENLEGRASNIAKALSFLVEEIGCPRRPSPHPDPFSRFKVQ